MAAAETTLASSWGGGVQCVLTGKRASPLPSHNPLYDASCSCCDRAGATLGCRVARCPRTYHLPCARRAGCRLNAENYHVACPEHADLFKHERGAGAAQAADGGAIRQGGAEAADAWPARGGQGVGGGGGGVEGLATPPAAKQPRRALGAIGGGRAAGKRRRVDPAAVSEHIAAARAARAKLRAELEAARAASSDDEQAFARKERRRLAKDVARLAPVVLGAVRGGARGAAALARGLEAALARGLAAGGPQQQRQPPQDEQPPPPQPQFVPPSDGFAAIGGLDAAKRALREMVLLPLTRPQLLADMGVAPPRGVLLHGAPGTGKTALVRALAGECAARSPRPVALFARKGADCLGKYAGDAERALRLLFQQVRTVHACMCACSCWGGLSVA